MKTTIITVIAVAAIVLAGCATPQEKAAKSLERQGPYCTALGFKEGTTEWRDCVVNRQASEDAMVSAIIFRR
ncbi:MAG: hypothetical protein K0M39_14775 [Rhizobium sp.]|nr:hypothetical protein [Rhizobium sp.]